MCGIVAAFSNNKNFYQSLLVDMMNKIEHRGYDDKGFYLDNGVAMAHNRLSIVGNKGQQPLSLQKKMFLLLLMGNFMVMKKFVRNVKMKGSTFEQKQIVKLSFLFIKN